MPNFIFCKSMQLKSTKDNRGFFHDYNNVNPDSYIRDLRERNLRISIYSINLDDQYNLFHDDLLSNINKHVPFKPITKKMNKQRLKPWITKGILKSLSVKNKYYKKFLKKRSPIIYRNYKYRRDLFNHLLRKSKIKHYASQKKKKRNHYILKSFKNTVKNFVRKLKI